MNYFTTIRSHTNIVVPREVPPENFLFVPEIQKERGHGLQRCLCVPLVIFLLTGGVLAAGGYFLHASNGPVDLMVEWPNITGQDILLL